MHYVRWAPEAPLDSWTACESAIREQVAPLAPGGLFEFDLFDLEGLLREGFAAPSLQDIIQESIYAPSGIVFPGPAQEVLRRLRRCGLFISRVDPMGASGRFGVLARKQRPGTGRLIIAVPSLLALDSCGIIARHLLRRLRGAGIDARGHTYEKPVFEDTDEGRAFWTSPDMRGDMVLHIDNVAQAAWIRQLPKARRWGYFYHELYEGPDGLARAMEETFERVDFVSHFCAERFDLSIPTGIVPHGIEPADHYPRGEDKALWTGERIAHLRRRAAQWPGEFVFLSIGVQQKRKGTAELITAFRAAFGATDEPVRLVIKDTERGRFADYDAQSVHPKITLLREDLSPPLLGDLYREADCFVLPTYGEGFGIPLLEARCCGLPVITTRHGGQTDFCLEDDSFLIDSMPPVPRDDSWAYLNAMGGANRWCPPDIGQLTTRMRDVYYGDTRRETVAKRGYERSRHQTWDAVLTPYIHRIIAGLSSRGGR